MLNTFCSHTKISDNERDKAEPILQSSTSGKSKKKKKKKKKQGEDTNSPAQVKSGWFKRQLQRIHEVPLSLNISILNKNYFWEKKFFMGLDYPTIVSQELKLFYSLFPNLLYSQVECGIIHSFAGFMKSTKYMESIYPELLIFYQIWILHCRDASRWNCHLHGKPSSQVLWNIPTLVNIAS